MPVHAVDRPISELRYSVGNDFCLENRPGTEMITIDLSCRHDEVTPPLLGLPRWSLSVYDRTLSNRFLTRHGLPTAGESVPYENITVTTSNNGMLLRITLLEYAVNLYGLQFECRIVNLVDDDTEETWIRPCGKE